MPLEPIRRAPQEPAANREPVDDTSSRAGPIHDMGQGSSEGHDGVFTAASKSSVAPATTPATDQAAIDGNLDVVVQSFSWLNDSAQQKLETLRGDLKREDEPDWFAQIAEALLDVALGAGAAGAGEFLASQVIHLGETASNKLEATHELVKSLFERGIEAGVQAGKAKLGGGKNEHVVDPFIDSQKEGVRAAQMENQERFIMTERRTIRTLDEAKALRNACSQRNVEPAALKQYGATRDAWISYLAQSRFGAVGTRGAVTPGDVNVGPTTTNMATQKVRDNTNKWVPGFVPEHAPELAAAMSGSAPGVLEVVAHLPEINARGEMQGSPSVTLAFLNGVNQTIRAEYAGQPLGGMKIPRQIVAKVAGDLPNFTVSLDEAGAGGLSPRHAWLTARATVDHPENRGRSDFENQEAGLKLLLAELVPTEIKASVW